HALQAAFIERDAFQRGYCTSGQIMAGVACIAEGHAGSPWASPMACSSQARKLFYTEVHLHGGPAPVRRFLPHLIDLVLNGKINPGKVFDLTLPLDQVAEGYRATDERCAIKALLLR